jgi:hypothetical protein
MADPKVVRAVQDASFDTNGRPIEVMRVEFRVGEDGPFVVRIPREEFSAERVRTEMDRVARELNALPR